MSTHSSGLSRQKIQPWNDAFRNLAAIVLVAGLGEPCLGREDRVLEHRGAVVVPVDDVEVVGCVQLPVAGFFASRTWAYSL